MHGQRRSEYKARQKDPKVAASLEKKADQWRQLTAQLGVAPPDVAMELTETLLRVNPDPLYIWNQRRDLIVSLYSSALSSSSKSTDSDSTLERLEKELHLTAAALQSNPKAYGAWFHRKWILCHMTPIHARKTVWPQELALTELFLQRDERNFHCWNYRRFIVSLVLSSSLSSSSMDQTMPNDRMDGHGDGSWTLFLQDDNDNQLRKSIVMGAQVVIVNQLLSKVGGTATEEDNDSNVLDRSIIANNSEDASSLVDILKQEWEFTATKIRQNFSNFSAFHYRSKLLPLLLDWSTAVAAKATTATANTASLFSIDLADEVQLVEDAVYTEPDDQTAWWYQAFLLDYAQHHKGVLSEERIVQHLQALKELADEVAECKWIRLGMLACLQSLPGANIGDTKQQQTELWMALIEMDPDRAVRYRHMLTKLQAME